MYICTHTHTHVYVLVRLFYDLYVINLGYTRARSFQHLHTVTLCRKRTLHREVSTFNSENV